MGSEETYYVQREFSFEAAHRLLLTYDSPCCNIHGHSYRVVVKVAGSKLDQNSMVFDFSKFKQLEEWVNKHWDHALIISENDIEAVSLVCSKQKIATLPGNVTAENMAKHLVHTFRYMLDSVTLPYISKINVMIWETAKNMAEYELRFDG